MINKTLALTAYCIRWLTWAFHYLVIGPAGTLVLIVALLFGLDNTTPGAVVVSFLQQADSITTASAGRGASVRHSRQRNSLPHLNFQNMSAVFSWTVVRR
ncbi:hypothetical protein B9P82_24805 [Citrobacter sp. L55]|uniref:conjugal transfer protein TraP n=1 Tax=Citrobacter sp. L55 TaxID=1981983 RepID=UPI000C75E57A|nr:conjugal transfer protein TraP [Citrobacter sp. L55]PLC60483.1 hypothetical protein B9P82_24805 [Citrobacter sp. L55]